MSLISWKFSFWHSQEGALTEKTEPKSNYSRRTWCSIKYMRKDYSITRPYYVFRKMRYLSGTVSLREDDSLAALRLAADRWVRSWECSGAVCRLPVRKLSLLTAYVTRHTLFGCVCVARGVLIQCLIQYAAKTVWQTSGKTVLRRHATRRSNFYETVSVSMIFAEQWSEWRHSHANLYTCISF